MGALEPEKLVIAGGPGWGAALRVGGVVVFDTSVLDQAWAEQKSRWEQERESLLRRVFEWLDDCGHRYGLKQVYIFGSLVNRNEFTDLSDIDLAVTGTPGEQIFALMAALTRVLGREVDVVVLRQCHFADKIRREGMVWTPSN